MKNPGDIITLIVNGEEKEFVVTERNLSTTTPCKFCAVRKKIDAFECSHLCGGEFSEIPGNCYLKEK